MSLSSHSSEEISEPPKGWRPPYRPLEVWTTKAIVQSKAFAVSSAAADLAMAEDDVENQCPVDVDAEPSVPDTIVVIQESQGKKKKMTRWPHLSTMMQKDGPYQCKVKLTFLVLTDNTKSVISRSRVTLI
jgi:hypothetical protein